VTTLEALAHELRQPLGAILSNAQAAQRLLQIGGERAVVEVREILEDIVACDKRAAGILRRMEEALRGAEKESGEPADAHDLRQAQGDGE
jgi:two-component system, LuxR family, sensor kinase FixL